jgi:hypothetical protein
MRFELTPNFSGKCTMRYVCSTRTGLNRMAIVQRANLTNRDSQNCSVFLHPSNIVRRPNRHLLTGTTIKYESKN